MFFSSHFTFVVGARVDIGRSPSVTAVLFLLTLSRFSFNGSCEGCKMWHILCDKQNTDNAIFSYIPQNFKEHNIIGN